MSYTFLTLLSPFLAATIAHAFSFNFTAPPTQCANATVQWTGGSAPFKLLLVPTGALHPEVRVIIDHTIDTGNNFSFPLNYPGNSTLVAVMSDATGFGAGGTTPIITVASAHDKSCLTKTQVAPDFFIFTNPPVPHECAPMDISYNTGADPPVDVFMVIPGGASSRIESGTPSNRSFEWTPALREGTQMMIVAGDTNGAGKGGSTDILTIAPGNSTSCLDNQSADTTTTPPSSSSVPSSTQVPSKAIVTIPLHLKTLGMLFMLAQWIHVTQF